MANIQKMRSIRKHSTPIGSIILYGTIAVFFSFRLICFEKSDRLVEPLFSNLRRSGAEITDEEFSTHSIATQMNPDIKVKGPQPSLVSDSIPLETEETPHQLTLSESDKELSESRIVSSVDPSLNLPLDGTFMQPALFSNVELQRYFDEINHLGMNTIIIQNTRTKTRGCTGEDCCRSHEFQWLPTFPIKLGFILDLAAHYGMDVYIGLNLTSHGLCPLSFYKEPNASFTIEDTRKSVRQMMEVYGAHPALAGWYLPDEPSISDWSQPELAYAYYAGLVGAIRQYSTKPILVSPHLVNIQSLTPIDLAIRAQSFRYSTGVDIILWQDVAGAEGVKLKWGPFSRSIGEYLAKIVEFLGTDATWSVHEAFNCCVLTREAEDSAAYRPTSVVRLSEQLNEAASASVGKKIAWIQQHHFGSVDPTRHPEAGRLLDAYSAHYGLDGEHLLAADYYWAQGPDLKYPDSGSEMFNLQIGNPHDFTNEEWVGIDVTLSGQAEIVIDLAAERVVRWVGFHLMSMPEVGITFPTQLSLACMQHEDLWIELGDWNLPVERQRVTSEYLFSNPEPLEKECRKIKASLRGDGWIFISEIEIVVASSETYSISEIPRRRNTYYLKKLQPFDF